MIKPIYVYGSPVLRKVANEIPEDYPNLKQLVEDMFETMYHSEGVGLAAPQIGLSIRLFVIDASPFAEDEPELEGFKRVYINPKIIERTGDSVQFNEGCLSIPNIREDVDRPDSVTIEYYDENFQLKTESYEGIVARIVQHEFDHLEGILFTDKVSPIRRQMLKSKLLAIAKGKVSVAYRTVVA